MINVAERIERSRAPYVAILEDDLTKMQLKKLDERRVFLMDKLNEDHQYLIDIRNEMEDTISAEKAEIETMKGKILLGINNELSSFSTEFEYSNGVFEVIVNETKLMTKEVRCIDALIKKKEGASHKIGYYFVLSAILISAALSIVFIIPKDSVIGICITLMLVVALLVMIRRNYLKVQEYYK